MAFSEGKRKLVHMSMLGFALLLRWLDWRGAALMAFAAVVYNLFVLPRLHGEALVRHGERGASRSWPIVYYAISVLILILVFPTRLHVAAAGWAVMAMGDGFAGLMGRRFGTRKLSWNPAKSVVGTWSFVVAGSLAAWGMSLWVSAGAVPAAWLAAAAFLAALAAGLVESLPTGIDDNLTVPLVAGAVDFLVLSVRPEALDTRLLVHTAGGLCLAAGMGLLAWAAKSVDASGFVAGLVVGGAVFTGLGWPGFIVLFAFFFLGSLATKVGYKEKAARGIAQDKGGRRGARNAVAKGTVGAVAALAAALTPWGDLLRVAFAASFATAAADTVSSEIGKRYGKTAYLATNFRRVEPGTEGAVSLEGTLAGIAGAALLALVAWGAGLLSPAGAVAAGIAGVVGNYLESVAGSLVAGGHGQGQGLENEVMNFFNTLVGAALGAAFFAAWRYLA